MKRLVSGIQPSGKITIGNYIGAISEFVKLQNELVDCEFFVFIADLHAITVKQDRLELRKNIRDLAAIYLASGLDSKRLHLFIQSEVKEHASLGYIMESTAYIGEMERMTQYKDKKVRQIEGVRTSLLTYPCLMAADILLYDANIVPVGIDQKQHLELTRDLAMRFNSIYGDTFVIPELHMNKIGKKIMSLVDPSKKMSKSDPNPKAYISLLDDVNTAKNKIKSAITDSNKVIKYDIDSKPGISNLLNIYSVLANLSIEELEHSYKNKTYADLKSDLSEIVGNFLINFQKKYNEIINSKYLDDVLDEGARAASMVASKKMEKINNKIGIGRRKN